MMKRAWLSVVAVYALSGLAAFADTKEDLQAAIKKLDTLPSYSWTTSLQGVFDGAPTSAKYAEGITTYTVSALGRDYPVAMKGDRSLVKTDSGWQNVSELQKAADDIKGSSAQGYILIRLQNFRTPVAQLTDLMSKVQNIQKSDEGFTADLLPEAAKDMMTVRFPGKSAASSQPFGNDFQPLLPPIQQMAPRNTKGTLKVTVKDGAVSRYEIVLSGTINFNDEDRPTSRTYTTVISDVGTTKVSVPDEARTKLDQRGTATTPAK